MANMNQRKNKSRLGTVVRGVAGAVAVAGVAVAVTRALKNRKTRDKVKKTATYVRRKAMKYVKALEKKQEARKIIAKAKQISKKVSRRKVGMPTLKVSAKKIAKKVKKVTK